MNRELSDILAMAERERQQSVLRISFPGWEHEPRPAGWTSTLRRPVTEEMAEAGILQEIRRDSYRDLIQALSAQALLIEGVRRSARSGSGT
ncbi:hypothetical protein [Nonomuraea sp. NPDC049709]|uniref:hypothetical protein n=1 Tax=Nonomuraea sp. NPDC049709 TaxID=3154736 RepID=UPI003430EA2A